MSSLVPHKGAKNILRTFSLLPIIMHHGIDPSNSTINRRRDPDSSSPHHSRSPPTSSRDKDFINPSCCISPQSPSEWVLGPDHQSETTYGGLGDINNSNLGGSSDFVIGSARLPCSDVDTGLHRGLNFMKNLHVIPISPMMDDSVDETWDFDFDEGRGGSSLTSRSRQPRQPSLFPDLSPRSERKQRSSLFSPVSNLGGHGSARDKEEQSSSNSPSCRGSGRRALVHSNSSKDGMEKEPPLSHRTIPRIQSARGPSLQTAGGDRGEMQVDTDSWAFKMIRHHSEPSLRPKCRQSTRNFYDEQTGVSDRHNPPRQHNRHAGPAPLLNHVKQTQQHLQPSSSRRKGNSEGAVLARITGRRE